MAFPKKLLLFSALLFGLIGVLALFKRGTKGAEVVTNDLSSAASVAEELVAPPPFEQVAQLPKTPIAPAAPIAPSEEEVQGKEALAEGRVDDFPSADRIDGLFSTGPDKLDLVQTITYTSNVPWLKGRPAWVADYAHHYNTSRHFIARSLNKRADYTSQNIRPGSTFNVLRKDKNIQFHLLVDLQRKKMGFYCIDLGTNRRLLLKTYTVGLGKLDESKESGSLTPLGKFSLDSKVAIYKPGDMGYFHGKKVEMVQVFGTRWIPLKEELERATGSCKGLGIHGVPWISKEEGEGYRECEGSIGAYVSGGSIRMQQADIEEIVAITITRPTVLEIVRDFRGAALPGIEE